MTGIEDIEPLLARTPPFSGFSKAERQTLASEMRLRNYPAQAVVLEQGSTAHPYVCLVMTGQLQAIEISTRRLVRTFGEGSFVGQYSQLREGPSPFQIEALAESILALIPASVFARLCVDHARVAAFFDSELNAFSRTEVALQNLSGAQFLFGTRLGDLIHRSAPQCDLHTSMQEAARIMVEQNCGYVVIMRESTPAGLLTDRDLRGHVAEGSPQVPVSAVMCPDPASLSTRHNLFDALLLMLDQGTSHILVRAGDGPLVGVIDAHDVARTQGYSPLLLLEQIAQAPSVEQLRSLRIEANGLLSQFYQRGVHARDLVAINTLVNDSLSGRVLELSESACASSRPDSDFRWAWLAMGSEGRGEMCLKTDQDNAMVFDTTDVEEATVQQWLAQFTTHVNQSLDSIGLTLCEANMMACNPIWRHRQLQWRQQFTTWLTQSRASDIMQLTAACDLRAVHGTLTLAAPVKVELRQALREHPRFLKHMAQGVLAERPPLSTFPRRIRTLRTEKGRMINIKRRGLQQFTDFARIMALQAGYTDSTNTLDRLDYLEREQPGLRDTVSNAREAWRHLIDIRLGHHLQQVSSGLPADDWLSIDQLGSTRREMLKAAFSSIVLVQGVLAQRFGLQTRW